MRRGGGASDRDGVVTGDRGWGGDRGDRGRGVGRDRSVEVCSLVAEGHMCTPPASPLEERLG